MVKRNTVNKKTNNHLAIKKNKGIKKNIQKKSKKNKKNRRRNTTTNQQHYIPYSPSNLIQVIVDPNYELWLNAQQNKQKMQKLYTKMYGVKIKNSTQQFIIWYRNNRHVKKETLPQKRDRYLRLYPNNRTVQEQQKHHKKNTRALNIAKKTSKQAMNGNVKVCVHFVGGFCPHSSDCRRHHPSKTECAAIRLKFAQLPCSYGTACHSKRCLYNHPGDNRLNHPDFRSVSTTKYCCQLCNEDKAQNMSRSLCKNHFEQTHPKVPIMKWKMFCEKVEDDGTEMEKYESQKSQPGFGQSRPGKGYVCNLCMIPGHWRQNCVIYQNNRD